jgi:hypothetical protein
MDIWITGYTLQQYRIDGDTDHDEKSLERNSEQGFQVIISNTTPFTIYHR